MPNDRPGMLYEFGDFVLDVDRRRLLSRVSERPVPLPAAAFATLLHLVQRAGTLIEKEALLRCVWPDVHVHENNLAQSISALRCALGDQPTEARYIATVPRSRLPPNSQPAVVNGGWELDVL